MAFVLIGAAIPAIRPRLPLSQRGRVVSGSAFKISKLVQDRLLWLFFLAVAMQALGYFTVMLYIPSQSPQSFAWFPPVGEFEVNAG